MFNSVLRHRRRRRRSSTPTTRSTSCRSASILPFRRLLERLGIRQITDCPGGFSAGPRRRTLTLPGAPPFAPLICYEIIFPGAVTEPGNRPGWLLNLTNDAWFGDTPGPYQHFLQARVRAVEEGLPLVRAANSGISAIVDAYGRVLEGLGVGQSGVDRRRSAGGAFADRLCPLRRLAVPGAARDGRVRSGSRATVQTRFPPQLTRFTAPAQYPRGLWVRHDAVRRTGTASCALNRLKIG